MLTILIYPTCYIPHYSSLFLLASLITVFRFLLSGLTGPGESTNYLADNRYLAKEGNQKHISTSHPSLLQELAVQALGSQRR